MWRKRATAFLPAFKVCFVPDVHLLPSQKEAWQSELSDTAFPLSTPIFLILTCISCLSHGKIRPVTRTQGWSLLCWHQENKLQAGWPAARGKSTERKVTQSLKHLKTALLQASVKERPWVNVNTWVCSEVNLWKACTSSVFHMLEMFKTITRESAEPFWVHLVLKTHAQTHPLAHKAVVPWLGRSGLECRHGETFACLKWMRLGCQKLLSRKNTVTCKSLPIYLMKPWLSWTFLL